MGVSGQEKIIALLQRVKDGDDEAQTELLGQYGMLIESAVSAAIFNSYVFAPADADDLRQEARMAICSAAETYDTQKSDKITFGLYAKICVRNRITSYYRIKKREKKTPRTVAHSEGASSREPRASFAALLGRFERILSKKEYAVLLARSQGMTFADIAQALDCSVKSVDNAFFRAKTKIRNASRNGER